MDQLIPAPRPATMATWATLSGHLLEQLLWTSRTAGYAPTVRDGATYPTLILVRHRRTARVYLATVDGDLRWHWDTTRAPLQAPATDPVLVLAEIARTLDSDQ